MPGLLSPDFGIADHPVLQADPLASATGGILGGAGGFQGLYNKIESGLAKAPGGSLDSILPHRGFQPRPEHSYRFLTRNEFESALKTGMLSPGPNSGGLLNFSNKPIAVYGAGAYRSPGMLVEMPNEAIAKKQSAQFYPNSSDSSAFTKGESIPLSEASRVFAHQWDTAKAFDMTALVRQLFAK